MSQPRLVLGLFVAWLVLPPAFVGRGVEAPSTQPRTALQVRERGAASQRDRRQGKGADGHTDPRLITKKIMEAHRVLILPTSCGLAYTLPFAWQVYLSFWLLGNV